MSVKLFIEMGTPQRAILVMDTSDLLECKLGTTEFNYDKMTVSGELRFKDVPWERLDADLIKKIKAAIDFPNTATAQEFMEKLHAAIPETKPPDTIKMANEAINEIIPAEMERISKLADTNEKKRIGFVKGPINEKSPLKQVGKGVQEVSNTNAVIKQIERAVYSGTEKKEKPNVIKNLADLPAAVNKQNLSKKERKKLEAQQKANKAKPEVKQPIQNQQKVETKHEAKVSPLATTEELYTKTLMSEYPNGFIIGHEFKGKDSGRELLIVSTPMIEGKWDTSLPIIFTNEASAKFVFEALLRHPRHSKMMGDHPAVMPISEINESDRGIEVALIKNGVSFVNSIEK